MSTSVQDLKDGIREASYLQYALSDLRKENFKKGIRSCKRVVVAAIWLIFYTIINFV